MGGRPWPTLVGLGAVVVAAAAALVGAGVPFPDVARWFAVVGLGVLLPGFIGVRAVRGAAAAAEDLAWSIPVGMVLALLTWAVGLALGSPVSPLWTGLAAAALLVVPRVRHRVLSTPETPGWGRGSGAVVVASVAVAAAWAWGSTLASLPLEPDRPFFWAPDVMFHAALTAEMGRTAAPVYPMVPEGTYPYHWFFHALAAHLGQGFGPLVVVTHLLPLTLLLGVVAMAAVATAAIARNRWGAAAGAVAVGVVGTTVPAAWVVFSGITGRADTDGPGPDPIRLYWQHSASTSLGWLAALGIVAASAQLLRGSPTVRRGELVLVLALGVLAAGAKSTQVPVLLWGFAAVVVLAMLLRQWHLARSAALLAALVGTPWILALLTMYAGGAQGLVLSPGARVVVTAARMVPDLAPVGVDGERATTPLVGVTVMALWLLPMVPRLLGLLWWARRPLDPLGVLCAATLLAGVAGTLLTSHPGGSEVFFLVSAYPVGVVGSAAGFVLAADRLRRRWGGRRVALACAASVSAGALATAVLASRAGTLSPLATWREQRPRDGVPGHWLTAREQLLAWAAPTLVLGAVVSLATVAVVLLGGRPNGPGVRRRASGVLVVLIAGLAGGGLVATVRDVADGRPELATARVDGVVERYPDRSRLLVTPTLREAAAVVRRSGSVHDIVVTNRVCLQPAAVLSRQPCDPREFVVAALTGRRTGVSGWAYAPESLSRAREVDGGYNRMPFWDPARLAEQRALVERPTAERLAAAWARGERWVLADRAAGPVSAQLATLGEVLIDRDDVVLVRIPPPRP